MSVQNIRWKFLFYLLVFVYILSFIFLQLGYEILSMIFIFGILGLVSLIPGYILPRIWRLEIMDFFVVILGVYGSPLYALFYYVGFRILSFSYNKKFYLGIVPYTIDFLSMSVLSFTIPILYSISGENFLITVIYFLILRYIVFWILIYFIDNSKLMLFISYVITDFPFIIVSTVLLSLIFGDTLNEKFANGLYFDFGIFLFCTFMIGLLVLFVYCLNIYTKKKSKIVKNYKQIEFEKKLLKLKEEKPFTYIFFRLFYFFENFKTKFKNIIKNLKSKKSK